jgi:hypothetical protein
VATRVLLLACAGLVLATGQAAAAQVDSGALIARITERPWGLGFDAARAYCAPRSPLAAGVWWWRLLSA